MNGKHATHATFQPGERVTIYILEQFPRVEGRATIIARAPVEQSFYAVCFENERVVRTRLVLPRSYQRRPETVTKAQLARWRAMSDRLLGASFFAR